MTAAPRAPVPRHSPSWYDAEYNNRARIPDHRVILQRWSDDSAQARARLGGALDVAYGDDPSERLDIFSPARGDAPILVYLHGGYWRALDKRDQSFVAPPFVAAGALTVLPNYALCPAIGIEHIARQLVRALSWIHRHARAIGGDPERICVAGHSAGGHLATLLLACRWRAVAADLPDGLVRAAVSVSGVYELEPLRHAPFLAPDLRLSTASARRLSPAAMPAPRGRLVTVVGADESSEFRRQAALISQAWGDAVVAAETVAGRHHMDVLDELVDPEAVTHRWALALLGLAEAPARNGSPHAPEQERARRSAR